MKFDYRIAGIAMVLISTVAAAQSPTTQPAWAATVEKAAAELTEARTPAMSKFLSANATISGFGNQPGTLAALQAAMKDGTVITARAYGSLPRTLATDLAADVADAKVIPDAVRNNLRPVEAKSDESNRTAQKWLKQVLQSGDGQSVGVILVWQDRTSDQQSSGTGSLLWVLMTGEDNGKITRIVYGNPLATTRPSE